MPQRKEKACCLVEGVSVEKQDILGAFRIVRVTPDIG